MALVHDIPESRTGDVNYLQRQYVERNELQGIKDMMDDTVLQEFTDIWEEYERRDCIEAKIVKDADNLDVDIELREQLIRGMTLGFNDNRREVRDRKLYTETAKRFFDMLETSNPHDWHTLGRNRFNSGDWHKDDHSAA